MILSCDRSVMTDDLAETGAAAVEEVVAPAPEEPKLEETPKAEPKAAEPKAEEPKAEEPKPTGWIRHSYTDEMSGRVTNTMELGSSNAYNFGFPYEGETRGHLMMRTKGKKKDVMLLIDNGQIMCHSFMNCRIDVRFDDDPIQKFRGSESADNDSSVVFLDPAAKFMAKAAKAKKVRVALTIYQEGTRIFEFDPG